MKIETILVPTDFSEDADKALRVATELADKFDARIELLHCYHVELPIATPMGGGFALPDGFLEGVRAHAEGKISQIVDEASGAGVEVTGRAREGTPSETIADEATRSSADLIVMGTRGLTGLKHVVMGSVAERTIRLAPCSVLAVKTEA